MRTCWPSWSGSCCRSATGRPCGNGPGTRCALIAPPTSCVLHFGSWNKAWERLVETKSRCPATSVAQASIIAELANRRCRANAKSWQRQIAVRLPAHSYDQLKQFAAKKGSAMQTLLAEAVEGYLAQLAGNTSGPRAAID